MLKAATKNHLSLKKADVSPYQDLNPPELPRRRKSLLLHLLLLFVLTNCPPLVLFLFLLLLTSRPLLPLSPPLFLLSTFHPPSPGTILKRRSGGKPAFDFPQPRRGSSTHCCLSPGQVFCFVRLKNLWEVSEQVEGVLCPQGIPADQVEDGPEGREGSRGDKMAPCQYTN